MLQAKEYGPDSTPDEVQAIKGRITAYEGDVLLYREVPVMSLFQVGLFDERLHELSADMTSYRLLVDLSESKPPGAAIRARLQEMFSKQMKCQQMAVFTEKNLLITVAAKFVVRGFSGRIPTSVHKTRAEALAALGMTG